MKQNALNLIKLEVATAEKRASMALDNYRDAHRARGDSENAVASNKLKTGGKR